MNPYEQLLNRKRSWTPVKSTAGALRPGAEEVIHRALAMRHMELPVGSFITDALKHEIPPESVQLLRSNVTDETKHDLALQYVSEAHGVDPQVDAEALRIRDAWVQHPDHTILKAMVAERSIFFVLLPLFRFNGDAGLRTVSADISRDEQVHVAANTLVCRELGIQLSESLDKLRIETIEWVLEPLSDKSLYRYLKRSFWREASDSLLYNGKAEGLTETRRSRMPAFFEHSNVNLPQYA